MKINENIKYNFFDLTLIQIGGIVSIPAIMVGFILTKNYGAISALISILFGNLIIATLAIPIAVSAVKNKQTTAQRMELILGAKWAAISAYGLVIVLLGWFAINISLISSSIISVIGSSNLLIKSIINSVIGALIIATVIKGIDKVRLVSKLAIPLFMLSVFATIFCLKDGANFADKHVLENIIEPGALLMVIAGSFTMVFDLPTYFRFAKSKKDGVLAVLITFIIGISLIEMLGVLFASLSDMNNIADAFMNVPSRIVLAINLLFILIGGWSVNNNNLYVSAVNLSAINPRISFSKMVLLLGFLSIILSFVDLLKYFSVLLNGMMILIASVTSLLIIDSIKTNKKANHNIGLVSIIIGVLFGIASINGVIKLYDFAYLEASVITAVIYILLNFVTNLKKQQG